MNAVVALKQPEPATPKLYLTECVIVHAGGVVHLSKKQAELLGLFVRRKKRLITMTALYEFVDPSVKSVDAAALFRTMLSYLKHKLAAHGIPLRIKTHHGIGRVYYGDIDLAADGEEFVFVENQ